MDNLSAPLSGNNQLETPLDIEMAIAMAPGLSQVTEYEGTSQDDILSEMAAPTKNEPLPLQLSSSWFTVLDSSTEEILEEFVAQGQSFFQASGDSGALTPGGNPDNLVNSPYVTDVGGTTLTMAGTGASWQSESTWSGSGGCIIEAVPIPSYQIGVNSLIQNGGSQEYRNFPDVAAVAVDAEIIFTYDGVASQVGAVDGTSIAAPLWAGFYRPNQPKSGSPRSEAHRLSEPGHLQSRPTGWLREFLP